VPFIQAHGGMNFYIGNTTSGDGAARARLGGTWDEFEAAASRAGIDRNDQDRYFVRRTIGEIGDSPLVYLQVLANKIAWLTQQDELRDTHSLYFFRAHMPVLAWLPGFGLILGFAAVGVANLRETSAPRWLLWPLLFYALTVIFFVMGLRYRAPLVPFVVGFAGAGIAWILDAAQANDLRRLGRLSAVGLVVFMLANTRSDAASRNVAEEWARTGLSLQQENNMQAAEAAYRTAIALDDGSSLAWDGLGLVLQTQGRVADARAAFERAVAVNSNFALAWYHVAVAREQAKDIKGALLAAERAIEIAPERTDMILGVGLLRHRLGRFAEAQPLLEKAATRGEGRAHMALALTAMRNGDTPTARRHAEEAVKLMPDYPAARELLRAVSQ
jgi:tetratricopeptide (TPR) repeat protein